MSNTLGNNHHRRSVVIASDTLQGQQIQSEIVTAAQSCNLEESDVFAIPLALEEAIVNAIKRLEVHVGPAGIVLSGVVVMPYEGTLAELVAKRHAHGMHVYSRIQVGVEGRPASRLGQ